jgi:hypothetical protein
MTYLFVCTGIKTVVLSAATRNQRAHSDADSDPYVLFHLARLPLDEPYPYALEMAMGKNPLGITCPNPYPRRKNTPAKKLIPMTGMKFCPNPYPCGFRVPNGFPIPTNINIKK